MRIVTPISMSDVEELDKWVDEVILYGNLQSHGISLLPTYSVTQEANEAAQKLSDAGISVEILKMQVDPSGGWPAAPNVHFFEAVRLMSKQNQPWLWNELDCRPIHSQWANILAGAYASCGSRFMGNVVKTPWRDDITKKPVKSPLGDDDVMMMGCSVYPANMAMLERFQPLLNDFMKGPDAPDTAFDIYLRDVIKLEGKSHSKMIDDKWNTEKFIFDGEKLSCAARTSHEGMEGVQDVIKRGGVVSPDAVMVHGCKDDSLHELIMAGLDFANIVRKSAPIPVATSQSTETGFSKAFPNPDDLRISKLEGDMGDIKSMLGQLLSQKNQPEVASDKPSRLTTLKPIDRIISLLESSEKKIRLDQAAEKLDIPVNKLKSIITEDEESRVIIGKLGWLSLADVKV